MQRVSNIGFIYVSFALLALGAGAAQVLRRPPPPTRATLDKIAKLSVPFVPNAGQWNQRAAFAAQTFAGTLFVTTDGQLVYSLPGKPIDAGMASTEGADLAALPCAPPSDAKSSPTNATNYTVTVGAYDPSLSLTIDPLLQSTYLGGTGNDYAFALAMHPASGEVYIAGYTTSTDLSSVRVASGGLGTGAQSVKSTGFDAFVTRVSFDLAAGDFVPNGFACAPKLNVPLSSLQTSDPAQIAGAAGNVPGSMVGGNFAEFFVSSTAGCGCDVQPYGSATATVNNNQYVCMRQVAPAFTPGQVKTTLVVGGGWADFIVSTGTQITSCNLDIDGSGGAPNPVSDGLMLIRAMLGFTGAAVTDGAIIGSPPRNTWPLIRDYLNQNCGTNFAP